MPCLTFVDISKGAELSDAEVMSVREEDGYLRHYQRDPEWYFDSKRCRIVGFQDYQRLALYDYVCNT